MTVDFLPLSELSWVFFPICLGVFCPFLPLSLLRRHWKDKMCREMRTFGRIPLVPQSPQHFSVQ